MFTVVAVFSNFSGTAWAQSQPSPGSQNEPVVLPEVEIRAQRPSLNDRFNAPGSRVIVTKDDIENMGADTVTDVLRQLPGVTTSTNAMGQTEIRLRGMDRGATQILIDGERQNNARRGGGLPIDQIPAELIERIEVIRAPMAEFSGASGGTINIVLKQALIQRETLMRAGIQHQFGETGGSIFFGRSGPFYDPPADNNKRPINERVVPPSYFFGASVFERIGGNDRLASVGTLNAAGNPVPGSVAEARAEELRTLTREVTVFPRASFRLSPKDQLQLNAFANGGHSRTWSESVITRTVNGRVSTSPSNDYTESERSSARMSATWNHRFTSNRLETRLSLERGAELNDRTSTARDLQGALIQTQQIDDRKETSYLLNSKLTAADSTHIWTLGGEIERRDFETVTTNSGLANSGPRLYESGQTRLSAFIQDEYTVLTDATLTLGIRVERLSRETQSGGTNYSDTWTRYQPNINLRLPINKEQQLRVGLSGLNRIPALNDVIDRVTFSTGGNSSTRPDTVGNPALRSERTLSLDSGIEFRNQKGVQWGLNAFVRASKDPVIRPTNFVNGRWVQRPINGDSSRAWGLESDLRAPLTDFGLAGFFVNASASYLGSKVSLGNVSDARIPGQPHYTMNINLNKPFPRGGGWFGGAVLNLQGASDLADTGTSSGRARSVARLDLRVGYLFRNIGGLQVAVNNINNQSRDRVRYDFNPQLGTTRIENISDSGGRSVNISFGVRF